VSARRQSCAKVAEPIEMLFGEQTAVGKGTSCSRYSDPAPSRDRATLRRSRPVIEPGEVQRCMQLQRCVCVCVCVCGGDTTLSQITVGTCSSGWLGSRVVSVLNSRAEGPRFKSQSGNSLRQTVHTHCAPGHQVAKLVAAFLRVAGVTAGLAESNGSLPPGS